MFVMKSLVGQKTCCVRRRRRTPPPSLLLLNIVTITIPLVSAIFLVWCLDVVISSSPEVGHHDHPQHPPEHSQDQLTPKAKETKNNIDEEQPFYPTCRIYMAPSSLGENAGYGIFTVEDIPKGHDILRNDAPNIPVIVDLDHIKSVTTSSVQKQQGNPQGNPLTLWHNVWWGTHGGMDDRMMYEIPPLDSKPKSDSSSNDGGNSSTHRLRIFDLQPTFGALPNHHEFRSNLKHRQPTVVYDDSIMKKKHDTNKNKKKNATNDDGRLYYYYPGRGAISYYKGKHFMADTDIAAGSEIFLNYGPNFLPSRGTKFAQIPRERDYYTTARLLRTIFIDPPSVEPKESSAIRFNQTQQNLPSSFSWPRSSSELIVAMLLYTTEYTTLEFNETTRQKIDVTKKR